MKHLACAAVAACCTALGASDLPGAVAEPISLDFRDVEMRTALQLIADFAGFNLVAGDHATGRVTLRLVDVPWDEALELVLATRGLGQLRTANAILVAPVADIAAHEKAALVRRRDLTELAPRLTTFIPIRYADASVLASLAHGDAAPAALSGDGSVSVDARTNSLIVSDTAEHIAAFRQIVERLDVPVRQVWIEARIVTANSNASEALGVRWRTDLEAGRESERGRELALRLRDQTVGVGILGADYLLDVELSALAAAGHAEIVARPKVVTADQRTAIIESGVEIPFQQATRSGATSIAFKDAVLQLEVTPRITPDGDIVMELDIKQDTVGRIYHGVPSINTTRIETRVRVADGETVVLGGIFQTDRHRTATRTPLLGDLPVLGRLFRRTVERDDKQELFIFITPRSADGVPTSPAAADPS
ncbi:MAG: pilus modification protein PilQ [Gammaproteobacteria bacterium]|nr:pilus modification protein PilQ [Gammaproteobacteria bacterium]